MDEEYAAISNPEHAYIPNLRTGVCSGYEIEPVDWTCDVNYYYVIYRLKKNTLNETLYLLEKN
jgi:hypothetical protein